MLSTLFMMTIWIWLFITYAGLGLLVRRFFSLDNHQISFPDLIMSAWWGWAISIFFLQIWHLFAPVGNITPIVFWFVGLIFFAEACLTGAFSWKPVRPSHIFWYLLFYLLSVFLFANHSILPPLNYDSGLYHINAIRWIESYAIVPGLGNLDGRLAFNSSYFLYAAFLENSFWPCRGYHVANGFLLSLFSLQALNAFLQSLFASEKVRPSDMFYGMTFFIFFFNHGNSISSPTPDFSVFLLVMMTGVSLLALLEKKDISNEYFKTHFVNILMMVSAGVVIKQSFFLFTLALILTIALNKPLRQRIKEQGRLLAQSIFVFGGFLIVWMIRGVILSGYIAYSLPWISFPVEWKIPHASVVNMMNWVISWNRMPRIEHWSEVIHGGHWICPWLIRNVSSLFEAGIPILLAIVGLVFLLIGYRRNRENFCVDQLMYFFIPPLISLVFWFLTVPAIRFASQLFWLLGLGALAIGCRVMPRIISKMAIFLPCILILYMFGYFPVLAESARQCIRERSLFSGLRYLDENCGVIVRTEKPLEFIPAPRILVRKFTTNSGLTVYTLRHGDRAWDPPLPYTLYPHPGLKLRKNQIKDGFVIFPYDENDASVGMHEEWYEGK